MRGESMSSKTWLHFGISFMFGLLITIVIDHTGRNASDFWWWAEIVLIWAAMFYNIWSRPQDGTRLPKLLGLLAGVVIAVIITKTFFWYDAAGMLR
jgi:hypothetical protein